jgi:hypothetical protein
MEKFFRIAAAVAITVAVCINPYCAQAHELEGMAQSGRPIKVFVTGFSDESGQAGIRPEDFKKEFEKALLNRKSVIFEIAATPAESDVQISGVIKSYQYLEKDPLRPSPSTATLILDAVTTENFVEMFAEFTVVDTRTGAAVWKDTVSTFIKRMMTPAESIPLIYEKLSRVFLWKSFGKGKN